MTRQLVFDLPVKTSRDRGDFFVSDANAMAVARLEDTAGWTRGKLALVGPEGAGKSHLAHVWAEAEGGRVLDMAALTGLDVTGVATPLAIEVADTAALPPEVEEALFHLHNHLASTGLPFLLVARRAPARWAVVLPDLKSRLEAIEVVHIDEPDDALLSAVLVKLFADRQVEVSPNLIAWLVARIDRSFAAAQRAVARLDAAALAEKRPVTRDLARRALDNPPE